MTEEIPITFQHKGKEYKGIFRKVLGAGSTSTFYLSIDNYHYGQLFYTEKYGWKFYSQDGELDYKSDEFGDYVQAWYQ